MNKLLISAAIASALAGAVATAPSFAGDDMKKDKADKEKCYGVAKAGKNSCASADGSHSCAGHATKDNDPNEWVYVKAGECVKMGGSLTPPKKM
jgi:uncharacterized membrane protein